MDTKLIQNDVMIANFEADPEKRNKIFKNEIQVYTKEHELDLEQHKQVAEVRAKEQFENYKKDQMQGLVGATPSMLVEYLKASNLEMKEKVLSMQTKLVQNKFVTIGDIDVGEERQRG